MRKTKIIKREPVDVEQRVRDLLDEIYPKIIIGYLEFSPSEVVEELDPTAFRCMVADESSLMLDEENYVEIDGEIYEKTDEDEDEEENDE